MKVRTLRKGEDIQPGDRLKKVTAFGTTWHTFYRVTENMPSSSGAIRQRASSKGSTTTSDSIRAAKASGPPTRMRPAVQPQRQTRRSHSNIESTMNFKVYSGKLAANHSVDVSFHGFFEAKSIKTAIRIIEWNHDYRYCAAWQVPKQDGLYVEALHSNFKRGLFVCKGEDPTAENVVWRGSGAVSSFFEKS